LNSRRKIMRKYVMLGVLLLCIGIVTVSPAATWTIDQITDNTETDMFPFVTRVPSGLTVVYTHNDGDNEAFVADNSSGSWATSRITDNAINDVGLDIASRPGNSDVHIALWWQDTPDQEISYCTGNTSSWNTERVTDDAEHDAWPSIEIDQNGFAHIVYYKTTGGDPEIFYSNNVTGSWVSEQVTDNAWGDQYPWLALDSDGNPHIVYIESGVALLYTTKTAGIWTSSELVAGGFGVNSFPYLVLDNEDFAHVCYAKDDGVDNEIYYANNVTGTWQEAKVTSNDYDDLYPTLFVDPAKKIHIAYVADEAADAEIFYANNVGGVWDIGRVTDNSVDDWAWLGRYFIYDAQGHGNIFFWNNSNGDDEIYVARSNEPIIAGVVENPPQFPQISITANPNPFSSATTVNYSIPAAGYVSLKIFDVSGSLVNTLVDKTQQEGSHQITWDGSNGNGTRVNSGVYFYHLAVNGAIVSEKVILK
jgi:hypothetical protein